MNKLLIGAVALSLFAGSAAMAQPMDHHGDQNSGYGDQHHGDQGDRGRHDNGDRGDRGDRGHRGHMVCTWRHHHRVCYRQHW